MTEREPFQAKCGVCSHVWTVAYLPMPLATIAKLLTGAICPNCGADAEKITPAAT